ncbi:MAG: rnc [Verrucomicrobiales bacterium]|nr:rnc [Verrucomicrobiales bacterium]
MEPLEALLGHTFQNPDLLRVAITHPSLAYETQKEHPDNQRLEYLGDAVLQLVLSHYLYDAFPVSAEGALTKLRSRLVSRPALAAYGRRLNLGPHLLMGRGEEASGGRHRDSALADAMEALVAAVYLDGGLEAARQVILRVCGEEITLVMERPTEVNPKGQLQEFLQSFTLGSPRYVIVSEEGPDHRKSFVARVDWNGQSLGTGGGASKKEAETAAAQAALESPSIAALRSAAIVPADSATPPAEAAMDASMPPEAVHSPS